MSRTSRLILTLVLSGGLATAGFAQEMASDETITQNVKSMIAQRPELKVDRVTVETRHGIVYLKGFVDTAAEHLEALAMQTTGVKKVVNNTSVANKGGS
jgi:osmotically-inducible protein OsmY